MKHTLFFISLAVAAIIPISCNEIPVDEKMSEYVNLTVDISGLSADTKVAEATEGDETQVKTVQLFVFDSNGYREVYRKAQVNTVTVSCKAGTKIVYAVTNAPDLSNIASVDALKNQVVSLSDNGKDSLMMVGSVPNLQLSGSEQSIAIDVKRLVSKIILKQIHRNFSDPILASKTMTVKAVYLTDAVANACLESTPGKYEWIHKLAYQSTEFHELTYDAINESLAQGGKYNKEHTFYAFPNPIEDKPKGASAGTWSERATMLVIEASIDGNTCYYPVYLPTLESNKKYVISDFTLTKLGSDHPWEVVESADVHFTINVIPWEQGSEYPETI